MAGCISCIKDGNTGECRDIKDKTARELIEDLKTTMSVLQDTINSLSGVDGGHLATDVDINNLQSQLNTLNESVTNLDTIVKGLSGNTDGLATTEDITNLQNELSNVAQELAGDIGEIQGQVNTLDALLNNLDNTYAKDSDITALQGQIGEIITSVNNVVDAINSLDNTYAKDTDITGLESRITTLENNPAGLNVEYLGNTNSSTGILEVPDNDYKLILIQTIGTGVIQHYQPCIINISDVPKDGTTYHIGNVIYGFTASADFGAIRGATVQVTRNNSTIKIYFKPDYMVKMPKSTASTTISTISMASFKIFGVK